MESIEGEEENDKSHYLTTFCRPRRKQILLNQEQGKSKRKFKLKGKYLAYRREKSPEGKQKKEYKVNDWILLLML